MVIAGRYSFNGGEDYIIHNHQKLYQEIKEVIQSINALSCKTKVSKEKTMPGKMLFNPKCLNKRYKESFYKKNWISQKVKCEYSTKFYTDNKYAASIHKGAFREMDFLKEDLGIEVQFGKYAFMVYNVCAKMTIFNKLGYIKVGVEIVLIKKFTDEMSTGVSYFEQFIWDLENRGVSDIDIPVLILGVSHQRIDFLKRKLSSLIT